MMITCFHYQSIINLYSNDLYENLRIMDKIEEWLNQSVGRKGDIRGYDESADWTWGLTSYLSGGAEGKPRDWKGVYFKRDEDRLAFRFAFNLWD